MELSLLQLKNVGERRQGEGRELKETGTGKETEEGALKRGEHIGCVLVLVTLLEPRSFSRALPDAIYI